MTVVEVSPRHSGATKWRCSLPEPGHHLWAGVGGGGTPPAPISFQDGMVSIFFGGIRGWNSENRWKTREADRSRSGRRWGVLIAGGGALF